MELYQLKKEYMDIFKDAGFDPEVVIGEVEQKNEFLIMPKETALLPELDPPASGSCCPAGA